MDVKQGMTALIEKKCADKKECIIDLNDLPFSKWDEVYIFSNVSKEYIQEKIKIPYSLYEDIGVKVIFISGKKITQYQELFPSSDSGGEKTRILFSFNEKNPSNGIADYFSYYRLTPINAQLRVEKQEYSDDGVNEKIVFHIHPANPFQIDFQR